MTFVRIFFLVFCVIAAIVGGIYVNGEYWPWRPQGVSADLDRGHYRSAAQRLIELEPEGDTRVLTTLANMYLLGLGVKKNPAKAAVLYSRAAFDGNVSAQINMGHLYNSGFGVTEDAQLAYAWFNLARNNGNKLGQEYMSQMLAAHKIRYHAVNELRTKYATINNLPKLH